MLKEVVGGCKKKSISLQLDEPQWKKKPSNQQRRSASQSHRRKYFLVRSGCDGLAAECNFTSSFHCQQTKELRGRESRWKVDCQNTWLFKSCPEAYVYRFKFARFQSDCLSQLKREEKLELKRGLGLDLRAKYPGCNILCHYSLWPRTDTPAYREKIDIAMERIVWKHNDITMYNNY